MKKRISWLIILIMLILTASVGVTLAWIVASSRPVVNTFTVGNIELVLTENTGKSYKMIPAVNIKKDPTVTVKAGSDSCWLFVKAEKSTEFDSYMTYEMADGWLPVEGEDNVYFRQVEGSFEDQIFAVLKENRITVKETITEEELDAVQANPTLTFSAYAIQAEGIYTVQTAWQNLTKEE